MVKLIFEFLKEEEIQFRNENIFKIIKYVCHNISISILYILIIIYDTLIVILYFREITKLDLKLSKLETIFNSVIAMKSIYCEEFQNITQHSFNNIFDISNKESLNLSTTLHDTTNILSNDNMEVSNEFNSNQFLNIFNVKHKEIIDTDNDVIYDNLLIRYTYVLLQFSCYEIRI